MNIHVEGPTAVHAEGPPAFHAEGLFPHRGVIYVREVKGMIAFNNGPVLRTNVQRTGSVIDVRAYMFNYFIILLRI